MTRGRSVRGFRRDVVTVALGSASSQALAFLVAPLLTRLFTPGEFGVFAAYYAVSQLVFPVASLRYSQAIVLPNGHRDGDVVLQIALGFSTTAGIFVELLFIIGLLARVSFLDAGTPSRTVANFLAVSIVLNSTYQCFSFWAARREQYGLVARSRLVGALSMLLFQVVSGAAGAGAPGLIAGDVVGLVIVNGYLIRAAIRLPAGGRRFYDRVDRSTIRSLLVEYRRFPLYNTWGSLLDGASVSLPPLLLLQFFSTTVAGLYALSFRVVYAPMSLLGQATSIVLFQRMSRRWSEGKDLRGLLSRAAVELGVVGFATAAAAIVVGPHAFAVVFGPKWRQAGQFARILAPSLALVLVASNVSSVLLVRQQQARLLAVQLLLLTATVLPLVLGGTVIHDVVITLLVFSLVQAAAYSMYIVVVLRSGQVTVKDLSAAVAGLPARRYVVSRLRRSAP